MATKAPPLSADDQEFYPLHEEDDVPEIPPHRELVTYVYDALRARFPRWFITSNVCLYWERGNTRDYVAPDLFVIQEPLTEPVARVYLLWQQPRVAFALEAGSRSTFRKDEGPKLEVYQERVRAGEYFYADPPRHDLRLWRMGPAGYAAVTPEPNGRLRSQELGLEFGLDDDSFLRIYTAEGAMLLTHEEEVQRRQEAEQQREEEARRRQEAEQQRGEEVRRRQEAEQQREEEAGRRREAEERAAELERQIAELRTRLSDGGSGEDR